MVRILEANGEKEEMEAEEVEAKEGVEGAGE